MLSCDLSLAKFPVPPAPASKLDGVSEECELGRGLSHPSLARSLDAVAQSQHSC